MIRHEAPLLLVSARDENEALIALGAGADIVDLKEPAAGALGAVPLEEIRAAVLAVDLARTLQPAVPVSATVGDWPAAPIAPVLVAAREVAASGVRWVKVGIDGRSGAAGAALLAALHDTLPLRIVPVLLADQGVDDLLLEAACALELPAVMLDTAGKSGGTLLDAMSAPALQRVANRVHAAGGRLGLAGSLRLEDIPRVLDFGPDVVGFRGAACEGGREGRLMASRVRALRSELKRPFLRPLPDDIRICF